MVVLFRPRQRYTLLGRIPDSSAQGKVATPRQDVQYLRHSLRGVHLLYHLEVLQLRSPVHRMPQLRRVGDGWTTKVLYRAVPWPCTQRQLTYLVPDV